MDEKDLSEARAHVYRLLVERDRTLRLRPEKPKVVTLTETVEEFRERFAKLHPDATPAETAYAILRRGL